ncbi:MAG: hypothetical protein O3C63_02020 [Cyanobacteria bacterium]|nr:hypothetical protein [Cyanobacteriota bacterium]MDA1020154.1 hypothetical protein [Cyanobacteriota bacterium]
MPFICIILISFLSLQPALAIYPTAKVKIHNAKLKSGKKDSLSNKWLDYIEEEPELLQAKDKDYKVDQYCSFSIEATEDGKLNLESIKLLKHENNIAYNLKAIQFLREREITIKQKNTTKPIELEFLYLSF